MDETVTIPKRDLLLVLDAVPFGRGHEQDAALRRLLAASGPAEHREIVKATTARFRTSDDVAERDAKVARLLAQRKSQAEVGELLGMTQQGVSRAKQRHMATVKQETALAELREEFWTYLDAILYEAWQVVHGRPIRFSNTGVRLKDADGNDVPDTERILDALDLARKVIGDQRKLTGADAPAKSIRANLDLVKQAEAMFGDMSQWQTTPGNASQQPVEATGDRP